MAYRGETYKIAFSFPFVVHIMRRKALTMAHMTHAPSSPSPRQGGTAWQAGRQCRNHVIRCDHWEWGRREEEGWEVRQAWLVHVKYLHGDWITFLEMSPNGSREKFCTSMASLFQDCESHYLYWQLGVEMLQARSIKLTRDWAWWRDWETMVRWHSV